MRRISIRWPLTGLIATFVAFGAIELRAAVVVSDQGLAADLVVGTKWDPWLGAMPGLDAGSGIVPSLAIEACDDEDPQWDRNPEELDQSRGNMLPGMATPNTSLSQGPGCHGGGLAIPNILENQVRDSPRANLPPESRIDCPRGPVFRWFRPPRV